MSSNTTGDIDRAGPSKEAGLLYPGQDTIAINVGDKFVLDEIQKMQSELMANFARLNVPKHSHEKCGPEKCLVIKEIERLINKLLDVFRAEEEPNAVVCIGAALSFYQIVYDIIFEKAVATIQSNDVRKVQR